MNDIGQKTEEVDEEKRSAHAREREALDFFFSSEK